MERKSFVFYKSYYDAIRELPREFQGEIYTAIIEYGLFGREPEGLKPMGRAIFSLVKPQVDANNVRYSNGCKGADYGHLGGRPKSGNNPKKTPNKPHRGLKNNPKKTPNVNVNDISSPTNVVEDNIPSLNPKGFIPPSADDMRRYFDEHGYTQEAADKAFNYYTELGWVDSKGNRISNWKLKCVSVWFKPENKKPDRPWGYQIPV